MDNVRRIIALRSGLQQSSSCCKTVFLLRGTQKVNMIICWPLPTKARRIFIIEYRSLRDFGPLGNNHRSIFI
jgi:hypothetical protein